MDRHHANDSSQGIETFGTPDSQVYDASPGEEEIGGSFYVRALYDFTSNDSSSLSFEKGALIEVLTQLESGWWDGLLGNDVRGWFPSNYVEVLSEEEAEMLLAANSEGVEPFASDLIAKQGESLRRSIGNGNDYGGLGLGQDFDVLRQLMTGVSPLMSNDAFEQLAEAGMRESTPEQGAGSSRTPLGSDKIHSTRNGISDIPSNHQSNLTDRTTMAQQNSVTSLLDVDNFDTSSTSSSGLRPGPSEKERMRAKTFSVDTRRGAKNESLSSLVEHRPRAATNGGPSQVKKTARRGNSQKKKRENDFWVPRVTDRGDIFYLNTRTGAQSLDMPDGSGMAVEGGMSNIPSSDEDEKEEDDDDDEEKYSSDQSIVRSLKSPARMPLFGRHTSTIYADSEEGQSRRASGSRPSTATSHRTSTTVKSRRNAIEFMPDPRDVPFPWMPRASDDERTYHYYNRETHEISQEAPLPADVIEERYNSTEEMLEVPRRRPGNKSRSGTLSSMETNLREEDVGPRSQFADERQAMELQQRVTDTSTPLQWLIDEASRSIGQLTSIVSEYIDSDGLSDQDRRLMKPATSTLIESSRLGLAIDRVVDSIRDLLYASGSLSVNSVDLSMVSELAWLLDEEEDVSGDALSAFQNALTTLHGKGALVVEPHVAVALQQATPSPPTALTILGKKINATLSKLVLSARSVIEQSCLNGAVRPELTQLQLDKIVSYRIRIRDDSLDLSRSLDAFSVEAHQKRSAQSTMAWTREVQGRLQSGKGLAGIGVETLGGGAAAGWRANGFVLPTATEAAALRAESMGSYQNPFELTSDARNALSSGKIALRRKPMQLLSRSKIEEEFSNQFGQLDEAIVGVRRLADEQVTMTAAGSHEIITKVKNVLSLVGSLLLGIEDIDLASQLDVDGPIGSSTGHDIAAYSTTVESARELLHQFASVKQQVYDVSNLIFVESQDLVMQASKPKRRFEEDEGETIGTLLTDLATSTEQMQSLLDELVSVAEVQGKSDRGQVGARAKVYGIDQVKLSDVTRAVDNRSDIQTDIARSFSAEHAPAAKETPTEEQGDDVMYLGPGLAVPNGPPPGFAPTTSRSSTLGSMPQNGLRARSTSVTTVGASVHSQDSSNRLSVQKEEETNDPTRNNSLKVNNKIKRFFGDDPVMLPVAPAVDADAKTPLVKPAEEIPWFLEVDYSAEDIVLNTQGQVKGATLSALMERLTMHNAFDANFNTTFLMTYRSFTSTTELLDLLSARFYVKEPAGLIEKEHQLWVDRKQMLIRFRIFNVLKAWLESHFYEGEDEVHLKRIELFVLDGMGQSPILATPGKQLIRLIERRSGTGEKMVRKFQLPSNTPTPILPKNFRKIKFLDIDPLEMARQLTLMDSRLYNRIRPVECLAKAWSRENGAEVAKAIRDVISANNKVSGWVSEAILVQEDLKKRSAWVKQFVAIADRCHALNNYSSMMAIYSGLNNASLNRLRRTWDAVNQRHLQMFEDMKNLLAPTKNFSRYRETLRMLNPPCVPFLGVYLTDLTFIEDGNSDRLKTDERLINFSKRQMTADKIQEIMIYQSTPYNLTPVPSIQKFIEENLIESRRDEELFEQSLRLEPREREDEKIARLLQESGFL